MGVQQLGDRIYLDEDIIVKTEKEDYDGVGVCMMPRSVKKVSFDDSFVIVKRMNDQGKNEFWLIDKKKESQMLEEVPADSLHQIYYKFSNVYGPMDSSAFFKMKDEKRVQLEW